MSLGVVGFGGASIAGYAGCLGLSSGDPCRFAERAFSASFFFRTMSARSGLSLVKDGFVNSHTSGALSVWSAPSFKCGTLWKPYTVLVRLMISEVSTIELSDEGSKVDRFE